MATTVLRVNLQDINLQFFKDLQASAGNTAEVEIRVETNQQGEGLFSEEQFWDIIDLLDWDKGRRDEIIQPQRRCGALRTHPLLRRQHP